MKRDIGGTPSYNIVYSISMTFACVPCIMTHLQIDADLESHHPALPKVQTTWDRQVVALVELPERADVEKAAILVTSKACGEPRKNLAVGRGHLHGRPLDVLAPPLSVAVVDGGALSTV